MGEHGARESVDGPGDRGQARSGLRRSLRADPGRCGRAPAARRCERDRRARQGGASIRRAARTIAAASHVRTARDAGRAAERYAPAAPRQRRVERTRRPREIVRTARPWDDGYARALADRARADASAGRPTAEHAGAVPEAHWIRGARAVATQARARARVDPWPADERVPDGSPRRGR